MHPIKIKIMHNSQYDSTEREIPESEMAKIQIDLRLTELPSQTQKTADQSEDQRTYERPKNLCSLLG